MYSFPKYIFELPDRTQGTSLSLLYLMSLSSNSFILVSAFFLRPLFGLVTLESTFFYKIVNWSSISESIQPSVNYNYRIEKHFHSVIDIVNS